MKACRTYLVIAFCGLITLILMAVSDVATSQAQSVDVRLEVISSGREQAIGSVRMVADPWGKLHVFYSAWWGDQPMPDDGRDHVNAVMYTFQEDDRWSNPMDVLAPSGPDEAGVGVNSVLIEPQSQQVFVLWRSDFGLFLSTSPIAEAGSARSWITQKLTSESTHWGSMVFNPIDGVLHLIYESRFRDIFHLFSSDLGMSWSEPKLVVSTNYDKTIAFSGSRLTIDSSGILHLVWEENASYRNWTADAVWYARSVNSGKDWEIKEIARSSPGHSSVGGINANPTKDGEVFLTWNRGAGSDDGRYYVRSTDSGITWSQPKEIWPNTPDLKGGQAGWSFVLVDSEDVRYLITSIEDRQASLEGVSNSLRYAIWNGTDWGQSFFLTTCEFPDATTSHGNRLHIVCPTFDRSNRIRYIRLTTPSRYIPPKERPNIVQDNIALKQSSEIISDSRKSGLQQESKLSAPISNSHPENTSFSNSIASNNTLSSPVIVSSTLSFLLTILVVFWQLRKRS